RLPYRVPHPRTLFRGSPTRSLWRPLPGAGKTRLTRVALTWLEDGDPFPAADSALKEPDGLLAISAGLSTTRLGEAYANGIFPWFSEGQPVLWWSPDPRMVLETAAFSPGRALRKKLARVARGVTPIRVRMNTAFD